MIVCRDDEVEMRKRALRDAILCIGWLKIVSVFCYLALYYFVHTNSKGKVSTALQIMICILIPIFVIHAILLFLGALEEQLLALDISLWLCLVIAAYNSVLGLMGTVYFIRTGSGAEHFVLAGIFALLALSLLTVLCHDVIIVYSYKQLLKEEQEGCDYYKCCESKSET